MGCYNYRLAAQEKYMSDMLIPTPIPEYDDYYAQDQRRPLCRYVYRIKRDALMADLFARLAEV